mgnify:CR=1 FL=1
MIMCMAAAGSLTKKGAWEGGWAGEIPRLSTWGGVAFSESGLRLPLEMLGVLMLTTRVVVTVLVMDTLVEVLVKISAAANCGMMMEAV